MTMASYIAFKSLRISADGVYSPRRKTQWDEVYAPFLGRLTYSMSALSLDGDHGVYAATIYEAWKYVDDNECRLCVVAPDAEAETEIGTRGWRTTCAYIIGELISLREAAELIVASHRAGYPQVSEILRWARHILALRASSVHDLVAQSVEIRRMIRAAAWGQYSTIVKGRKENEAGVTWSTKIRVVAGDKSPVLVGRPCLVTHFRRGRFRKTLFTPSTLRIEVGEEWPLLTQARGRALDALPSANDIA